MPKRGVSHHKNPETGVTPQQDAFAYHYAILGHPARAYRKAYDASRMSYDSVREEARRLLENPDVLARVAHYRQIADRRLEVTIERIAREYARIGFANPADLFDDKGKLLPVEEWPEDLARVVSSVKVKRVAVTDGDEETEATATVTEIRFWNKNDALLAMAKWKRMIVDRVEHIDPNDPSQLTDEQLDAEIRANNEAIAVIERARARRKPVAKAAPAGK